MFLYYYLNHLLEHHPYPITLMKIELVFGYKKSKPLVLFTIICAQVTPANNLKNSFLMGNY